MSQKVVAVVGGCCVSEKFRAAFFAEPRRIAEEFVGPMTDSELQQIDDLAGHGTLPGGVSREDFKGGADEAFGVVYSFYTCPTRPCPIGG